MKRLILSCLLLVSCGKVEFQEEVLLNHISSVDEQISWFLEINGGGEKFILPNESDLSKIPQDPKNELNIYKIRLGQLIFHDNQLSNFPKDSSKKYTYSCSSCHLAENAFTSGNFQGIGEGGVGFGENRIRESGVLIDDLDVQSIRVPTNLNSAYQKNVMWDGRLGFGNFNQGTQSLWNQDDDSFRNSEGFLGVETQAMAGLKFHGILKAQTQEEQQIFEASKLFTNGAYINLFNKAFPSEASPINIKNTALALAAYGRSILSSNAPWQKYLRGDKSALSDAQKNGANIFFGKGRCVSCHSGPALSDGFFYSMGFKDFNETNAILKDEVNVLGRGNFVRDSNYDYKFKTPQLYNLKDYFALGHGGSFKSVRDVVEYKVLAVSENPQIDSLDIYPINLNPKEIDNLVDFVENSLYDNNLMRYKPLSLP